MNYPYADVLAPGLVRSTVKSPRTEPLILCALLVPSSVSPDTINSRMRLFTEMLEDPGPDRLSVRRRQEEKRP
jgi:hypothetical protein